MSHPWDDAFGKENDMNMTEDKSWFFRTFAKLQELGRYTDGERTFGWAFFGTLITAIIVLVAIGLYAIQFKSYTYGCTVHTTETPAGVYFTLKQHRRFDGDARFTSTDMEEIEYVRRSFCPNE